MSAIQVKWVSEQQVGNNHAKHLLLFLSVHHFHKPGIFFKVETIAKQLELSIRAVQRAFKLLEDKKLIIRESRFNNETGRQITNGYYLNIPQSYVDNFFGNVREGDYCAPLGVTNRQGEGVHWSPSPPQNSQKTSNISNDYKLDAIPNNNSINNKSNNNSISVKKRTPKRKRKPEIRLPDDYTYNGTHIKIANELNIDLHLQFEIFKDHALQNDRMCRDWNAAFRNWLRNTNKFSSLSNSKKFNPADFVMNDLRNDYKKGLN
jgi:hypothetical protein